MAEADVKEVPDSLRGLLGMPGGARGVVIFAHGTGSGRLSPRNNHVAAASRQAGFVDTLLDLLTPDEENDRRNVFNIHLLASRLMLATEWIAEEWSTAALVPCYLRLAWGQALHYGPPLCATRGLQRLCRAVAAPTSLSIRAPTLLLVGSLDTAVIEMNQRAYAALTWEKCLSIVKGPVICLKSLEGWMK